MPIKCQDHLLNGKAPKKRIHSSIVAVEEVVTFLWRLRIIFVVDNVESRLGNALRIHLKKHCAQIEMQRPNEQTLIPPCGASRLGVDGGLASKSDRRERRQSQVLFMSDVLDRAGLLREVSIMEVFLRR